MYRDFGDFGESLAIANSTLFIGAPGEYSDSGIISSFFSFSQFTFKPYY